MKKGILKYVLLSDVVGSRLIADRKSFEKKLAETVRRVQQQFAPVFEMPIQVWKGLDETAAMLKEPWRLYEVMDLIDESLAPFQMRFVVVKGGVDVMPQSGVISEADGEAFHLAATRMLALKQEGLKFSCDTGDAAFDSAWQTQVNLLWLIKQNWTERQRSIYRLYSEAGLQESVARRLKISQQTVSKALKSISAAQVQPLEHRLTDWTEKGLKP